MTSAESCSLLVDTVRQLSAMHHERDSWRLVALAALSQVSELTRELQMVDERQYVCRTRTQDERDVFLDQTDLRTSEAA